MKLREYGLFTRLIRTRPLLLAALLYLAGCILGYALNLPIFVYTVAMVTCLAAVLLVRRKYHNIAAALLLIAMLPAGMLSFDLCWRATQPFDDQPDVILCGRICETPQWNPETERTICVLEDLQVDAVEQRGRLRLYLRGDINLLQQVQLGQRIECSAHIWRADEATNPGQFNFSNYLRVNNLRGYATAEIENARFSAPEITLTDKPKQVKAAIDKRIERLFTANPAIAKAFLIGEKNGLSDEERDAYAKSGAAHLLAISGMHISILAGVISWMLSRFLSRKYAFALTMLLLLNYGLTIGFSSSLLRAILMFAVFASAPLIGRYSDAPTRFAAALLISLMMRPSSILEAGFVLSYGATAGIIFLYNPLLRLVHADKFIEENTNVGLFCRSYKGFLSKILSSLIITAAAQLAILPAIVHFFGAQPLWSFAVNLLAAPLAMAGYVLSIVAALLNSPLLASVPDFLFSLLTRLVSVFGNIPLASVQIARFPAWLLLLCFVFLFLSTDLCRLNKKLRSFLPLFVLLAIPVSNLCSHIQAQGCSVVFLDAGQADCAVIRTEGKIYLVDTGDSYTPAADYLSALNYPLDGIFISHCHTDHAGGLAEVLDVCTPETIYISKNWHRFDIDESVSSALERAAEQGSSIQMLETGDAVQLSGKTLLRVLSPSAGFSANSANDDSLILHMSYGECDVLFCGDAPTSVCFGIVPDIDLMKVSHHGGRDALDACLLDALSPSVAFIPVGYNNFGHPDALTLELLEAAGSRIFRADENGAVCCRLREDGSISVQAYQTSEDKNGLE